MTEAEQWRLAVDELVIANERLRLNPGDEAAWAQWTEAIARVKQLHDEVEKRSLERSVRP